MGGAESSAGAKDGDGKERDGWDHKGLEFALHARQKPLLRPLAVKSVSAFAMKHPGAFAIL